MEVEKERVEVEVEGKKELEGNAIEKERVEVEVEGKMEREGNAAVEKIAVRVSI